MYYLKSIAAPIIIMVVLILPMSYGAGIPGGNVNDLSVESVIDSLLERYNRIEDYSVRVKITVKMPRFRMPRKRIDLYYKRPNKIKVEADGFAVVPRTGLTLSPNELFNKLTSVRIVDEESTDNRTLIVLEGSLNPDSMMFNFAGGEIQDTGQLKMQLFIDPEGWFITQVNTQLDTTTIMSVVSEYQQFENNIWLPEITELSFYISGEFLTQMGGHDQFNGPFRDRGDQGISEQKDFRGTVMLEYSRYKINKGIKDKIFSKSDF